MLGLTFTSPHNGSLDPRHVCDPRAPVASIRGCGGRLLVHSPFRGPIDLIAAAAKSYVRITWKLHTQQRFARPMMTSSAHHYFRRWARGSMPKQALECVVHVCIFVLLLLFRVCSACGRYADAAADTGLVFEA
ncbi:hypothetical protein CKAH01_05410 [Colletotrichum kahawae]|uniref:Uncharacterized protein n=1 Tax=Colletotrichum kahawae TaxID=34407 RepID=A0AAD9YDJ3_COLKA|nr:hypothetical protein CKAH01_05410 [Colletotrichum kahawae]